MKKSLSILCVVALLIGLMIPVSAASVNIGLTATSTKVTPGANFDVTLNVADNTGILGGTIVVKYSSDLTLNSAEKGTALSEKITLAGKMTSPFNVLIGGDKVVAENGSLAVFHFTAPTTAGKYTISVDANDDPLYTEDWVDVDVAFAPIEITVEGSTPTTTPKTVTYTAENGTVIATTAAWDGITAVNPAATSITTEGEELYFYFFPAAGYTTSGMTATKNDVALTEVIGSSLKVTPANGDVYKFTFAAVAVAEVTTPSGSLASKSSTGATTFGTAVGASEYGILIAAADDWKATAEDTYDAATETGKIRKYVALEANSEGQFAIELQDATHKFLKENGTYIARIFAANGASVKIGDIINITIAD